MNPKLSSPLILLLFLGLIPIGWAAPAADGHAHSHGTGSGHDHGTSQSAKVQFSSPGDAWAVIAGSVKVIETCIETKNLTPVHDAEEKIVAGFKYLQTNSPMVTGDKGKRLESALKQAVTVSGQIHAAADANDLAKTQTELKKLTGALKLIEAQYPAGSLAAPATAPTSYVCPMKDGGASDKPGQCPKCGMDLKAEVTSNHGHTTMSTEPTSTLSAVATQPLKVGEKSEVLIQLSKKDGSPLLLSDLKEAHTKKIHLLIIDSSLTDYHHEHPEPGSKPGEYQFSFTPKKPGSYRVWADLVPMATGTQEYVITDIAATSKGEPISDRKVSMSTELKGLKYEMTFDKSELIAGEAATGKLRITSQDGATFSQLEPVMGAYAHIVGFGEDYQSIAHIHPMGVEPTKESDRGMGELAFHFVPEKAGLVRMFAQVRIAGADQFAPFTLLIKPNK